MSAHRMEKFVVCGNCCSLHGTLIISYYIYSIFYPFFLNFTLTSKVQRLNKGGFWGFLGKGRKEDND